MVLCSLTGQTLLCLEHLRYRCARSLLPVLPVCIRQSTHRVLSISLLPTSLHSQSATFFPCRPLSPHAAKYLACVVRCHWPKEALIRLSQDHQHQVIQLMSSLKLPCPRDVYWYYTGNDVAFCKCGPKSFESEQEKTLSTKQIQKLPFPRGVWSLPRESAGQRGRRHGAHDGDLVL